MTRIFTNPAPRLLPFWRRPFHAARLRRERRERLAAIRAAEAALMALSPLDALCVAVARLGAGDVKPSYIETASQQLGRLAHARSRE